MKHVSSTLTRSAYRRIMKLYASTPLRRLSSVRKFFPSPSIWSRFTLHLLHLLPDTRSFELCLSLDR